MPPYCWPLPSLALPCSSFFHSTPVLFLVPRSNAQFHPLMYLEGLAAAAVRRGVRIFEGTKYWSASGCGCQLVAGGCSRGLMGGVGGVSVDVGFGWRSWHGGRLNKENKLHPKPHSTPAPSPWCTRPSCRGGPRADGRRPQSVLRRRGAGHQLPHQPQPGRARAPAALQVWQGGSREGRGQRGAV